jgi:DNA-binding NarL/FixJ family response regulator
LLERGELQRASELLRDSRLEGPLPPLWQFNDVLGARGRLRLAQGRPDDALEDLLECGRRLEAWGVSNPDVLPWRSSAAFALQACGHLTEASELARGEVEASRRMGTSRSLGIALRAHALVGEEAESVARLGEAVDALARSAARVEHARALVDLGGALRRRGHTAEARRTLRRGLDAAAACGAWAIGERAREDLLASGARPRRLRSTGVDALTASERRVVDAAAGGRTNREIAQDLFVTEKTVELHLRHAYRKLGVRSRAELPDALDARR